MQIVNEWEARGEARGTLNLVLALLRRRLGTVPADLQERVGRLAPPDLQSLAESLFDLTTVAEVEAWLATHG